jgi:hypothetical protein
VRLAERLFVLLGLGTDRLHVPLGLLGTEADGDGDVEDHDAEDDRDDRRRPEADLRGVVEVAGEIGQDREPGQPGDDPAARPQLQGRGVAPDQVHDGEDGHAEQDRHEELPVHRPGRPDHDQVGGDERQQRDGVAARAAERGPEVGPGPA